MVESQLVSQGIRDERVLAAMAQVEREAFVPTDMQHAAYGDHALAIDCGQTISQPFTVAFMIEAARIRESDKVLEIGTGSGYGAAVLSLLASEVHTVERIPQLAKSASERLRRLGYVNAHVHVADGTLGLPQASPFDAIIVTAGAKTLPPAYVDQLNSEGRIVIPTGANRNSQKMVRFTLTADGLTTENLGRFVFVPLIGANGWPE